MKLARTTTGLVTTLGVGLLLASAVVAVSARREGDGRLVVHEWGTFTSVVGEDGMPVAWRPLSGPPDLPRFVYQAGDASAERCPTPPRQVKASLRAVVRMETPVLYFYTDRERSVSVDVAFPQGQITEWYPRALAAGPRIAWGPVELRPASAPPLLREDGASHYYLARETDAVPVRVGGENERFLFYRGVGTMQPQIDVMLDGSMVKIRNVVDGIPRVVLFENRGGKVGYGVHALNGRSTRLPRPHLDGGVESLCRDLEGLLIAEGLFPREARAMVDTWRDSWFEEGLRVFFVLPRRLTDEVLPLRLDPKPDALVRVLVARTEVITTEAVEAFAEQLRRLESPSAGTQASALSFIRARGRFAEPILRRVQDRTGDAALRSRIEELIQSTDVRRLPPARAGS